MHPSARELQFRPHPKPMVPLAVSVRSVGHYRLRSGEELRNEPRSFVQLFWGVAGEGVFHLRRRRFPFGPGVVFLYGRQEPHFLLPTSPVLEYRWLTLDGRRTASLLAAIGLERRHEAGPCPAAQFDAIARHIGNPTAEGERAASIEAYALLVAAARPGRLILGPREGVVRRAQEALDAGFTDPAFNINRLCDQLRVHRSTLFRLFRQHHGVAPIQYLSRLRLREALRLLRETSLPVAEIAGRSGVGDSAYLSRLVRRATGQSPRAFRSGG